MIIRFLCTNKCTNRLTSLGVYKNVTFNTKWTFRSKFYPQLLLGYPLYRYESNYYIG